MLPGSLNVLETADRLRQTVTAQLYTQPVATLQNLWTLLPSDRHCKFRMGANTSLLGREFLCPQCQKMERFVDLKTTPVDRPFPLPTPGQFGILSKLGPISNSRSAVQSPPRSFLVEQKDPLTYVQVDPLSHTVVAPWLLDDYLQREGLPSIQRLHSAFICSDDGYGLYDAPDLGTFANFQDETRVASPTARSDLRTPLSPLVAQSLVAQLMATLRALEPLAFTHGQPGVGALLFNRETANSTFDGFRLQGPMTLKLCQLSQAALTLPALPTGGETRVRLYSTRPHDECYADKGIRLEQPTPTTYRLNRETAPLLLAYHHMGIPKFGSSFDTYAFMTGLMAEPTFYQTVQYDDRLRSLWQMMWSPDDLAILDQRLCQVHTRTDTNPLSTLAITRLLRDLSLQIDILPSLWTFLKS